MPSTRAPRPTGYRSRAAFKLQQLVQRGRLLRRGDCVVELGAWPGGWLQVVAAHVGPKGRIVGVDLQAIETLPETNVITLVGDISDRAHAGASHRGVRREGRRPPVGSGSKVDRRARARRSADAGARRLCPPMGCGILKPQGTLVIKLFMGNGLAAVRRALAQPVSRRPSDATRGDPEGVGGAVCGRRRGYTGGDAASPPVPR